MAKKNPHSKDQKTWARILPTEHRCDKKNEVKWYTSNGTANKQSNQTNCYLCEWAEVSWICLVSHEASIKREKGCVRLNLFRPWLWKRIYNRNFVPEDCYQISVIRCMLVIKTYIRYQLDFNGHELWKWFMILNIYCLGFVSVSLSIFPLDFHAKY